MVDSNGACIYCGTIVNLRRGQGDHVIPAALGRFDGEFIFRRICGWCNSLIGKCEEQLLKCAPEAFVRRMVKPAMKRNKRGTNWVGAHGIPPPKFTINHGDHHELVNTSTDNPDDVIPIDQLVIVDAEKGEYHVPLSPAMTVAQLRAKIDALGVKPSKQSFLHVDGTTSSKYFALMRELWPDVSFEEAEGLERGVHRVKGRATFTFHADYWRAIAKIGFHYYLLNTRRGVRGDEPAFADLRRFIMEGGDDEPFFKKPAAQFALPFGELSDGRAVLPHSWTHVLAADETQRAAVAMVTLFMGPKRLAPVYHINLARLDSPIVVPGARCTHSYMYNAEPSEGTYAGRVVAMSLTQLR